MKIFTYIIASILILSSCKKDELPALPLAPASCTQNSEPEPPYFEYDNKFDYSVKIPDTWTLSDPFSFFAHDSGKNNSLYCSGSVFLSLDDNGSINKGVSIYIQKADPRCSSSPDSMMAKKTFNLPTSNEKLSSFNLNLDSILFNSSGSSMARIELQVLGWKMNLNLPDILINNNRNNIKIQIDLSSSAPIISFYINEVFHSNANISVIEKVNEENYLQFESKLIISDPSTNSTCTLKVPEIHLELWNW